MISEANAPQPVKAPHLYIGTPTHDNRWHVMTTMSMVKLVGSGKFNMTHNKVSGGGIHKARNNIISDFLKSDAQKLLWVDSDISFDPQHVIQLYARDAAIIGMPYCHKKIGACDWSARAIDGKGPQPDGTQELGAIGFGFVMIDRKVPEAMIKADGKMWPATDYIEDWNEGKGEKRYDFFQEGVVQDAEFGFPQRTYVTEDFYFCYKARKLGFKVMADCTSYVHHWDGGQQFPDKNSAPPAANPQPERKEMPSFVNETDLLTANR